MKLSVPHWLSLAIAIALPLQGVEALTQRLRQPAHYHLPAVTADVESPRNRGGSGDPGLARNAALAGRSDHIVHFDHSGGSGRAGLGGHDERSGHAAAAPDPREPHRHADEPSHDRSHHDADHRANGADHDHAPPVQARSVMQTAPAMAPANATQAHHAIGHHQHGRNQVDVVYVGDALDAPPTAASPRSTLEAYWTLLPAPLPTTARGIDQPPPPARQQPRVSQSATPPDRPPRN